MIVSAAAKLYFDEAHTDWAVIPLHRHKDCGEILSALQVETWDCEDGFLTNTGKFLDRRAALDEAIKCGQITADDPHGYDVILSGKLMSEDLW